MLLRHCTILPISFYRATGNEHVTHGRSQRIITLSSHKGERFQTFPTGTPIIPGKFIMPPQAAQACMPFSGSNQKGC
jgi:hypothetical protein